MFTRYIAAYNEFLDYITLFNLPSLMLSGELYTQNVILCLSGKFGSVSFLERIIIFPKLKLKIKLNSL